MPIGVPENKTYNLSRMKTASSPSPSSSSSQLVIPATARAQDGPLAICAGILIDPRGATHKNVAPAEASPTR